ncbi:hypothetical protein ACFO3K_13650 [Cellulomonas algicola]|uniref:hypothetical protein n=1 Tax=Cellulomonas algicola TaxID=2071633 RepID=UPI000F5899AA|nr:hypothetical protein [Cellulomonas algicola]
MPVAVATSPLAVVPDARVLAPAAPPAPVAAPRGMRHQRRRLHAALGPRVMRAVVVTATTLALVPALSLVAGASGAVSGAPTTTALGAVAQGGLLVAALVAVAVWLSGSAVGVPVGTVAAWLALRPLAVRDLRRLEAALAGVTVVQGVGIRPGYGRSRAVELADGSVVTITRLVERDDRGRQVGFTRSGGVDRVSRAAAAMALTAHQQAVGETPWFPSLVDGRRPQRWGTFGTTP